MRRIVGATALIIGTALWGCGGSDAPAESAAAKSELPARADVTLVAREFDFGVPEMPRAAESARFTLRNEGDQGHHAVIYRLLPETSPEELTDTLMANEQGTSGLAEHVGASATVGPGEDEWFGVSGPLEPGTYAVACFLKDQSGSTAEKIHVELGMIEYFEVI